MIEVYRLPLAPMALDTDTPEIHAASHEHLLQHVLHRAFSVPDAETFDRDRAKLAEDAFAIRFGLSVDADMRRSTREDADQTNWVYKA